MVKKDKDVLVGIVKPLTEWYEQNKRKLPWREEITPYRVWVSEIMLQQTRVEVGKGYFERFINALPDVETLANAEDETLMKLWEGLGYYNRAKNLKKAAGIIVEQYSRRFPATYEELLKLPGVGTYTAGAIASIAYEEAVPAVDGNVLRVISRILMRRDDITKASVKKSMEGELREIMPKKRPGEFNQALMELGALICLPNGAPKCGECPVRGMCQAKREGIQTELPIKKAKKARRIEERTVLVLIDEHGQLALRKRAEQGLLAGLWELPSWEGCLNIQEVESILQEKGIFPVEITPTAEAKHIFSHIEWHMWGYCVNAGENLHVAEERATYGKEDQSQAWIFACAEDLEKRYTIPSAFNGFREYFPKE